MTHGGVLPCAVIGGQCGAVPWVDANPATAKIAGPGPPTARMSVSGARISAITAIDPEVFQGLGGK